ncbi:stalk domain-containing protein [Paenibacillus tarimensis]|uniref:stalk domain-containing protein n=1 Tax=Paenibacillus tarimensis TaxID=416012 RepID=UPI001F1B0160|nr:stalk domain-containing protein [Paenibacillus tarimensis]MCF2945355.1 copper amine oxidase N-terminal domain-containing protein [Paenibacillus tarimensis]
MKKFIEMKKSVFVTSVLATSLVFGAVGAFGATGLQKITAYLNHDIKFELNGSSWTPLNADGSKATPITYDGNTYLPARAVAEAVGTEIGWSSPTKTVFIGQGAAEAAKADAAAAPVMPKQSQYLIELKGGDKVMTAKMKAEALKLAGIYAKALETGKFTTFNAYVDKYTSKALPNSPIITGQDKLKEQFAEYVNGGKEANSAAKVKSYVAAIKKVKLSGVDVTYVSEKNEFSQTFKYGIQPPGWDAFSTFYVNFVFSAEQYGSSKYILEQVYFS